MVAKETELAYVMALVGSERDGALASRAAAAVMSRSWGDPDECAARQRIALRHAATAKLSPGVVDESTKAQLGKLIDEGTSAAVEGRGLESLGVIDGSRGLGQELPSVDGARFLLEELGSLSRRCKAATSDVEARVAFRRYVSSMGVARFCQEFLEWGRVQLRRCPLRQMDVEFEIPPLAEADVVSTVYTDTGTVDSSEDHAPARGSRGARRRQRVASGCGSAGLRRAVAVTCRSVEGGTSTDGEGGNIPSLAYFAGAMQRSNLAGLQEVPVCRKALFPPSDGDTDPPPSSRRPSNRLRRRRLLARPRKRLVPSGDRLAGCDGRAKFNSCGKREGRPRRTRRRPKCMPRSAEPKARSGDFSVGVRDPLHLRDQRGDVASRGRRGSGTSHLSRPLVAETGRTCDEALRGSPLGIPFDARDEVGDPRLLAQESRGGGEVGKRGVGGSYAGVLRFGGEGNREVALSGRSPVFPDLRSIPGRGAVRRNLGMSKKKSPGQLMEGSESDDGRRTESAVAKAGRRFGSETRPLEARKEQRGVGRRTPRGVAAGRVTAVQSRAKLSPCFSSTDLKVPFGAQGIDADEKVISLAPVRSPRRVAGGLSDGDPGGARRMCGAVQSMRQERDPFVPDSEEDGSGHDYEADDETYDGDDEGVDFSWGMKEEESEQKAERCRGSGGEGRRKRSLDWSGRLMAGATSDPHFSDSHKKAPCGARGESHDIREREGGVFAAVRVRSSASRERKASLSAPNPLPGTKASQALDREAAGVCSKLHVGDESVPGIPRVAAGGITGTTHGNASWPRHRCMVSHGRADGADVELESTPVVAVKVAGTGCRTMRFEPRHRHRQVRIARKRPHGGAERQCEGKPTSKLQPPDGDAGSFMRWGSPRPVGDGSLREMHGSREGCTDMGRSRSKSRVGVHSRQFLGKYAR